MYPTSDKFAKKEQMEQRQESSNSVLFITGGVLGFLFYSGVEQSQGWWQK